MSIRIPALAGLALGLAAVFAAPAQADEAAALRRAAERGRLIYAYDGAAWVSSDAMLAAIRDPGAAGVRGYVVEPGPEAGVLHAVYFRWDGDTPKAVFTAEVRGRQVLSSRVLGPNDDATLSPAAVRLVAARKIAVEEVKKRGFGSCAGGRFNTVALPPENPDGPVAVYVMTPQVKNGEYPNGGHYEIDVAADGAVASERAFTRSCLTLGGGGAPAGAEAAGVFVTHTLDPTPTEMHVFTSLSMGLPVFVGTGPDRVWRVQGDRIELVDDKKK